MCLATHAQCAQLFREGGVGRQMRACALGSWACVVDVALLFGARSCGAMHTAVLLGEESVS